MEVQIIVPFGFCEGVNKAIEIAKKAKIDHPDKLIHVLGMLVHNEEVIEYFVARGFKFYDERIKSLNEWIKEIPDGEVMVFAAHGHDPKLDEIARNKHLIVYDATCAFVKGNAAIMKTALKKNRDLIYIGKKNHAECTGAVAIDEDRINLFDVKDTDTERFHIKGEKPLVVTQTTIDKEEIDRAVEIIKKDYPSIEIADQRCFSTKRRQEALINSLEGADLVVILGSENSNNTMKLFEIARSNAPKAKIIRALNVEELKGYDLTSFHKAILSSGASTSDLTFEEVKKYLLAI
ncbi:MAG: 4-hydroxy-3-methylbut-2-enyl diphosphate reductase [Bacilli bacterium]|nr:4-hydroxy-3-methylbut-2-enyl diphosphate reductase [Bacilli bacterium]